MGIRNDMAIMATRIVKICVLHNHNLSQKVLLSMLVTHVKAMNWQLILTFYQTTQKLKGWQKTFQALFCVTFLSMQKTSPYEFLVLAFGEKTRFKVELKCW